MAGRGSMARNAVIGHSLEAPGHDLACSLNGIGVADASDFAAAYRSHFADIRRFVFHFVRDAGVADELTQDAFLRA